MSYNVVRRRNSKAELGSKLSSLVEPLLNGENNDDDDNVPKTPKEFTNSDASKKSNEGDSKRKKESILELKAWKENIVNLVAQWMTWFGHVFMGAGTALAGIGGSMVGLILLRSRQIELPPLMLSPSQEENLRKLQKRLNVPFDGTLEEHQEALRALWRASYDEKLTGLVSEQWKNMGWQGTDPSTDFRGGGFISLENLLHFAYRYPRAYRRLLSKEEGERAVWEYPFAVAGLNITFMLVQLLDLRAETPNSLTGRRFMRILGEDEKAFDNLYCVAFEMLDAQWLAMKASYMEFNAVLSAVRIQLEQALSRSNVDSVSDLPTFQRLVSA